MLMLDTNKQTIYTAYHLTTLTKLRSKHRDLALRTWACLVLIIFSRQQHNIEQNVTYT